MDRSPCSKPPRCGHRRCYPTWRLVQSRAGRCRHSEKSLYQQLLSSWERVPGGGEHPIKAASKFTGPDDPVFCNRTGRPHTIANLNKRTLKPTAESLGMGWVSWHSFRRTHATLLDQANAAIADRIAQMGHSAFATTLKYRSADIERRRGTVEQISALVHGTGEREPSENQG